MKTLTILFLAVLGFYSQSFSQWQHVTNGIENRYVYTLAVQGNTIYAGASIGGVYFSSNNGSSWQQTSLSSPVIQNLYVDGNFLFAGTGAHGIYYTSNNGINWIQTNLTNKTIFSFTKKNNTYFAGSDSNGVYASAFNGVSWVPAGLAGKTVYALTQAGGNIIAGLSNNGMYVSTDEGASWIPAPVFNLAVFQFAVDNSSVFAGTSAGVYKSTNFGFNWSQIGLDEEIVGSIAISGSNIFAGTFSAGVYVSNNYGTNWIQRNEGLTQLTASSMCILNNYIYNGTQSSVFRRPINELIGIQQISSEIPLGFSLSQNYPNPFNPVTNIKFDVPQSGFIELKIYNINGKEVTQLVHQYLNAGSYKYDFDALGLPSGVYFYRLGTEDFTDVKKMILIK